MAVVLRTVLQKGRNVALKRANPRKGCFKEEIGRRRGAGRKGGGGVASKRANPRNGCFEEEIGRKRGPGRKGGGGKVNLPPYRCLVHADESANPKHNVQDLAKRP